MGSGIAQVCAARGMSVILSDRTRDALDHGLAAIKRSLGRVVKKGDLTAEQAEQAAGRVRFERGLDCMAGADFVVEAVPEDEGIKRRVFEELDSTAPVHAILASNTSSISITKLASYTARPHRVCGFHFMNPPPVMRLVELTRGAHTSQATFEAAKGLAEALGKVTVVSQDRPVRRLGDGEEGAFGACMCVCFFPFPRGRDPDRSRSPRPRRPPPPRPPPAPPAQTPLLFLPPPRPADDKNHRPITHPNTNRRASSSTACCSRPSTRPFSCCRRAWPTRTTSTSPCASGATSPWGPWRSPTTSASTRSSASSR
jgi:hypothetical protein